MTREYTFTRSDGKKAIIQDHGAGHRFPDGGVEPPHFNVRNAIDPRHSIFPGTKPHYPFLP
ncbi:hypothetical protein HC761_01085 [bacterium]|nr:hypothetical protein [bacterium]